MVYGESSTAMHVPLAFSWRGTLPEITCYGALAWVRGSKLWHQRGAGDQPYFLRSLAKPLQLRCWAGELEAFLTPQQQVLAVSSHNGEAQHLAVAQSMLAADEAHWLQTPACGPLSGAAVRETSWHHPCSGNHAGVLRLCKQRGWDLASYREEQHPFHQQSLAALAAGAGAFGGIKALATDGCGFSTPAFTLGAMAALYADFAARRDENGLWGNCGKFPSLLGGTGRLDSQIIRAGRGEVFAKEGADGLLALAVNSRRFPEGIGVVIKLAHGRDVSCMEALARTILSALGYHQGEKSEGLGPNFTVVSAIVPESL